MARFPFPTPLQTARRSLDAAHFNAVANDDAVRPFLGGDGEMDLTPVIANFNNYAFATEHGGYILLDCGAGRYDVHSFFLPPGRGKEATTAMREVSEYMFTHTDCLEGRTTLPVGNLGAEALAIRGGFERRFEMRHMRWKADHTIRATFMALSLERWALTSATVRTAGEWFHGVLEHAKLEKGSEREVHADDPIHDRFVGAALLMLRSGNTDKGINFYNAWALTAGYQPITLVTKRPLVVDVIDAIVEANEDAMEILLCR